MSIAHVVEALLLGPKRRTVSSRHILNFQIVCEEENDPEDSRWPSYRINKWQIRGFVLPTRSN